MLSQKERLKRWGIQKAWKALGVRYMVTGISIAQTKSLNEYNRYDSIGVRDSTSYELLRNTHANVAMCPDMACLRMPQLKVGSLSNSQVIISLREKTPDDGYSNEVASGQEVALAEFLGTVLNNVSFYAQVDEDIDYNSHGQFIYGCF